MCALPQKGTQMSLPGQIFGQKRVAMSALPPKADINWKGSNVRLVPEADIHRGDGLSGRY